jgi:phosphatidylglycerol:prolipoprotein diacylglycerol transferase
MIEFTRNSVSIFGFDVYYYGIILMTGVVAGGFLAASEAKRKGKDQEFLWDSLFWMVIGGVVGARLWHILTPPPSMVEQGITTYYYLTHPLFAINPRYGGLGIPGAVIGGVVALYWYTKRHNEDFRTWIDIIAPAIPLGQAIGRWGNFVNQEVYGAPSNLPWAIYIDPAHRLPEFANIERYHPIFLYESLWSLASVFFLLWLAKRYKDSLHPGDLFLTYMITYPTIRILLDFLRLDASQVGGMNANQTLMVLVLAVAAATLYIRHSSPKKKK